MTMFYLTLYNIIPKLNNPQTEKMETLREKKKCWKRAFSPIPKMLSIHPQTNFCF